MEDDKIGKRQNGKTIEIEDDQNGRHQNGSLQKFPSHKKTCVTGG